MNKYKINNNTKHIIINGDSRNMSEIESQSIHLIITSPPYWQLKDYDNNNQIGFNDSYEEYINYLNLTWQECFRVLKDGCRLCINIGDQFARTTYYGRYKVIPIHSEIIRFCETLGMDFMGQIIWKKATTMNTTGGATIMGSYPYPRNGIVKLDFEYILLFKKHGVAPKPTELQKEESKITKDEWNTYFNGHWYFPGTKQNKHIAMFPEELPIRLIKMFSFTNETVLDPFLGSGTTSIAAKKLLRNSVGYEINSNFIKIIQEKLNKNDIFNNSSIIIKKQNLANINFKEKINKLPYKFIDFHKLNKKIDIKTKQYGSKIDNKKPQNLELFYTIKKIISPELIELNNNLTIKLIGIKQIPDKYQDAINFLDNKLKGKKVFIKYDSNIKYDDKNHLMVYLYLKNKTFINLHLLKEKLVILDNSINFKYKEKWQKNGF